MRAIRRTSVASAFAISLSACFSGGSRDAAVPAALGCVPPAPLPDTCSAGAGARFDGLLSGLVPTEDGPPTAGQMSEDAVAAKHAFDVERWADAAERLQRVAAGQYGDDLGNRQLAEYLLAIAHYRLRDFAGAADLLVAIRASKNHLKFHESLLWLAKLALAGDCAIDRVIHTVAKADDDEIERFHNPQQRDLYAGLLHIRARGQLDLGERNEARDGFARVENDPKLGELAKACLTEASR